MFCINCGNKVVEKDNFCKFCGTKVNIAFESEEIKSKNNRVFSSKIDKVFVSVQNEVKQSEVLKSVGSNLKKSSIWTVKWILRILLFSVVFAVTKYMSFVYLRTHYTTKDSVSAARISLLFSAIVSIVMMCLYYLIVEKKKNKPKTEVENTVKIKVEEENKNIILTDKDTNVSYTGLIIILGLIVILVISIYYGSANNNKEHQVEKNLPVQEVAPTELEGTSESTKELKMNLYEETEKDKEFNRDKLLLKNISYLYDDASFGGHRSLHAVVNNVKYLLITADDLLCFEIENVIDFNHDGYMDILVEHAIACGGNIAGSSFFVFSFNGNKFIKSKEIGHSWAGEIEVKQVNNNEYEFIVNQESGAEWELVAPSEEFYAFKNYDLVLSHFNAPKKITALTEIKISDFRIEDDNETRKQLFFDINNNGTNDVINCRVWERWGTLICDLNFDNGQTFEFQGKRIGILSSETNGYHDIVVNFDEIYRWNNEKYVENSK